MILYTKTVLGSEKPTAFTWIHFETLHFAEECYAVCMAGGLDLAGHKEFEFCLCHALSVASLKTTKTEANLAKATLALREVPVLARKKDHFCWAAGPPEGGFR